MTDCRKFPQKCEFISKAEARVIAQKVGLEEGIHEWQFRVNFVGDALFWVVNNALRPGYYGYEGKQVTIDANSGNASALADWKGSFPSPLPQ